MVLLIVLILVAWVGLYLLWNRWIYGEECARCAHGIRLHGGTWEGSPRCTYEETQQYGSPYRCECPTYLKGH